MDEAMMTNSAQVYAQDSYSNFLFDYAKNVNNYQIILLWVMKDAYSGCMVHHILHQCRYNMNLIGCAIEMITVTISYMWLSIAWSVHKRVVCSLQAHHNPVYTQCREQKCTENASSLLFPTSREDKSLKHICKFTTAGTTEQNA